MSFLAAYFCFVCPCALIACGLFALSAARRGWLRAALVGLGLALPLGFALAKAGYLCFYLAPQWSRWGIDALVLARVETFSFTGGCAGAALGIAAGARLTRVPSRKLLCLFAPFGAALAACFRLGERWMGTLGAGALLPEGHWAAGTVLSLADHWGEAHWAVYVPEAAFALIGLALALTRWKKAEDRLARTALWLCCGQVFLELLRSGAPSWRFARIDQVWCAAILLGFAAAGCARGKQKTPLIVTALLLGLNAYMQFVLDKPELLTMLLPTGAQVWTAAHIRPVCYTAFLFTAAGLWFSGAQSLKGIYSPSRNIRSIT